VGCSKLHFGQISRLLTLGLAVDADRGIARIGQRARELLAKPGGVIFFIFTFSIELLNAEVCLGG
jgi:hypothetical protein